MALRLGPKWGAISVHRRSVLLGSSSLALALAFPAACSDTNGPSPSASLDYETPLQQMCDLMIPETDTRGAVGVGTHQAVDRMLINWASPKTRLACISALDWFQTETARRKDPIGTLTQIDQEAFSVIPQSLTPDLLEGYRTLKSLIFRAYYMSEYGATVELQYESVPGAFLGCVPLDDVGRAWSI